jgi:hypothetical protein
MGVRDTNQLTNILFWARHPDFIGEKLQPNQKDLVKDWLRIRDQIVKPALAASTASGTAPAGGTTRTQPTSGTTIPSTTDKPERPSGPPAPSPTGPVEIQDKGLAAFVAALNNPAATAVAQDLAALQKRYADMARVKTEEIGKGRDEMVAGIAALRRKIAGLDGSGLDPAVLGELKKRLYRVINDISPYYSQLRNIDVLEGKKQAEKLGTKTSVRTRTCNITSLSMALESLGKSANDYDSSKHDEVLAAAKLFNAQVRRADFTVAGDSAAWSAMAGLRLSDFLELAAIAEVLKGGKSSSDVTSAAVTAWGKILSIYFLKTLANRFGASGTIESFTLDPSKSKKEQKKDLTALSRWGGKHRKSVEKLVDARNAAETATGKARERAEKKYQRLLKQHRRALSGTRIEKRLPIESYKNAVIAQAGGELDSGAAIVVNITGHYVRLQTIYDDHVVVDDPGRLARANRKVTWEEARAMGYFKRRLVLRA